MRSFLVVGGLVFAAAVLFSSGILPRRADATDRTANTGKPLKKLEFEYARFEDEQALLAADRAQAPATARDNAGDDSPDSIAAEPTDLRPMDDIIAEPVDFGDEPPDRGEEDFSFDEGPEPVADAGRDLVVWLGRNELTLDGGASTGEELTYFWEQISGPHTLKIADSTQAKTTVRGFMPDAESGWVDAKYEFALTVLDLYGRESTDRVRCEVRTTPTLSVRPRARHRLALRDGYLLDHLECWQTNTTGEVETFQVRSPGELFIQQIGGQSDFEVNLLDMVDGYVYQIAVFYREGQSTTYVEFFVDTSERIPAVLQLGVNWE